MISQCKPRHRHQEFLGLLRQIEKSVPEDLDVHLIVDNYCTHKHAKVRSWLAQRPRFHVHYTPTYASWQNQVERWFGIITQRAIRRGSLSSVLAGGFRAAVGADRQDRTVRGGLQQDQGPVQLVGRSGFNPGEAPATLLANLRDGTLVPGVITKGYSVHWNSD